MHIENSKFVGQFLDMPKTPRNLGQMLFFDVFYKIFKNEKSSVFDDG